MRRVRKETDRGVQEGRQVKVKHNPVLKADRKGQCIAEVKSATAILPF